MADNQKPFILKVWNVVKNPYVAATLIFLALFLFFDENNFFVMRSLRKDVRKLHQQEALMSKDMVADSIQANRLKYDLEAIERYGRENYYMKSENEDIFIVVPDDEKQ